MKIWIGEQPSRGRHINQIYAQNKVIVNSSGQDFEPLPCSLDKLIGISKDELSREAMLCCLFPEATWDISGSTMKNKKFKIQGYDYWHVFR